MSEITILLNKYIFKYLASSIVITGNSPLITNNEISNLLSIPNINTSYPLHLNINFNNGENFSVSVNNNGDNHSIPSNFYDKEFYSSNLMVLKNKSELSTIIGNLIDSNDGDNEIQYWH